MGSINVCFSLKSITTGMESNDVLDKDYQTIYKPIAKFLYSHPNFCFSFAFSGNQLQFLKKKRSEFISICRELVDRKQIEVIGGGFYDAVLPLIYPVDRNGQIDLLSAEIRQNIGKRPRGVTLFADCWDASLVNNLQTCGIEYVLLDGCVIPPAKRKFLPLIMSDLGKTIEIFPYYDSFVPQPDSLPEKYIAEIIKTIEKIEKKDSYVQLQPERVINIHINHEQMVKLIDADWFKKFDDYLAAHPEIQIKTTTPSDFKRNQIVTVPAYIPGGINSNIAKWIGSAYNDTDFIKHNSSYTVYDFMEKNKLGHSLYNRIMYVSMLVNQYKNDKVRKKSARDKLWQAQNGSGLICTSKGIFANTKYRQQCYKFLNEAEKILREGEDSSFSESLSCFDYNGDGLKEYVCRMKNYFSYITLKGGAVQELDILKNGGNYIDNLCNLDEYEGKADAYERGLFIDHVFTDDQFKRYLKKEPAGDGVFSRIQYKELKVISGKREIHLYADAVFQPTKQKISLVKKYIVNSNGMTVQYILKNESNSVFKAKFAVESNLTHTNFIYENMNYFTLDVVDSGKKITLNTKESSFKVNSSGKLESVYLVRFSDLENGVAFDFEPNENCNFCYNPYLFSRPGFDTAELKPAGFTYCSTLYWDVEIEPGMEIEKYINLTITSIKKQKK